MGSQTTKTYTFKTMFYALAAIYLLARAWQHFFWDVPLRTFFWNESLLSPFLNYFEISWSDYVGNIKIDLYITYFQRLIAAYILTGIPVIFLLKENSFLRKIYFSILFVYFTFLFLLYSQEKFFQVAMIMEFSLQWILLLYCAVFAFKPDVSQSKVFEVLKIFTALTFVAHGMYAVGAFPRPGNFIDMTISILGCSEEVAVYFLNIVGAVDFFVAIGVFFAPTFQISILYMVFWGFMTALARLWANVEFTNFLSSFAYWMPEFLMRLPHFIIPFALFYFSKKKRRSITLRTHRQPL